MIYFQKKFAYQNISRNDELLKIVYGCEKYKYDCDSVCLICFGHKKLYFSIGCKNKDFYCFDCFENYYGLQLNDYGTYYYNEKKCLNCYKIFTCDDLCVVEFDRL